MNWAVVGDATAIGTISYFDPLLRDARFAERVKPDVVVRLGACPLLGCSKSAFATGACVPLPSTGPDSCPIPIGW